MLCYRTLVEKGNTMTNNTFKTFPVICYLFLGKRLLTQSYHFNRFDRWNFLLTGGWASASCPHMVVYCIKFVLRGESPRDYVDMLRSLAFPPSINISDMPHHIATHANHTVPHFFRPNDGRLFPPTEENIDARRKVVWFFIYLGCKVQAYRKHFSFPSAKRNHKKKFIQSLE